MPWIKRGQTWPSKRPWNKPALLALERGESFSFTVEENDQKKMRAIRKMASVAGEENERVYSVRQEGDTYTIIRTA